MFQTSEGWFSENTHDLGILSHFPLSSVSHVRESGGILILSTSYLCSGFWVEGEQLLPSGRKSETFFLPAVPMQRAGPWCWSDAPPCLKKHDCTSVAVVGRYLARLDGWRSEMEVFNHFSAFKNIPGVKSSLVPATPFLLPNLSAHIHVFIQHLQSILKKRFLPFFWRFFLPFISETFLRWLPLFAVFKWLFDYRACLSSQL